MSTFDVWPFLSNSPHWTQIGFRVKGLTCDVRPFTPTLWFGCRICQTFDVLVMVSVHISWIYSGNDTSCYRLLMSQGGVVTAMVAD